MGYLRKLAASDGYFVRRQELELVPGALHLGAPPREVSLFTVCYGWETSWHPDPTGQRLRDAVAVLDNAGACDDDLVFWDFCCLYQWCVCYFILLRSFRQYVCQYVWALWAQTDSRRQAESRPQTCYAPSLTGLAAKSKTICFVRASMSWLSDMHHHSGQQY